MTAGSEPLRLYAKSLSKRSNRVDMAAGSCERAVSILDSVINCREGGGSLVGKKHERLQHEITLMSRDEAQVRPKVRR